MIAKAVRLITDPGEDSPSQLYLRVASQKQLFQLAQAIFFLTLRLEEGDLLNAQKQALSVIQTGKPVP